MTVPSTRFREDYAGNGSATSFPYAFRIFKATDLVVTKTDSSGTDTTLTLGTDYTVTGAGSYNGGAVVLSTALPTSYRLTIERVLSIKQETDLRNQGEFLAETHEDAFDRLTMIVQRLAGYLGMGQGGTLRTLLLGTGDVDGSGAFRARGNRISGLGTPIDDADAVSKRWTQEQIAGAVNVNGSSMLGVFAITVDTIAGASSLLWPDKATVIARGADAVGDGRGGIFRFSASSTQTPDGVYVFAPTGSGRLIYDRSTLVGTPSDNVVFVDRAPYYGDLKTALQNAPEYTTLVLGAKNYDIGGLYSHDFNFGAGPFIGNTKKGIRLLGSGMPKVNSTGTALEDGTVIQGTLFNLAHRFEAYDLGVDVGLDVCNALYGGAYAEGFIPGANTSYPVPQTTLEGIRVDRVIALGRVPTGDASSWKHTMLFENLESVKIGTIEAVGGYHAYVSKSLDLQCANLTVRGGMGDSINFNANAANRCRNNQYSNVKVDSWFHQGVEQKPGCIMYYSDSTPAPYLDKIKMDNLMVRNMQPGVDVLRADGNSFVTNCSIGHLDVDVPGGSSAVMRMGFGSTQVQRFVIGTHNIVTSGRGFEIGPSCNSVHIGEGVQTYTADALNPLMVVDCPTFSHGRIQMIILTAQTAPYIISRSQGDVLIDMFTFSGAGGIPRTRFLSSTPGGFPLNATNVVDAALVDHPAVGANYIPYRVQLKGVVRAIAAGSNFNVGTVTPAPIINLRFSVPVQGSSPTFKTATLEITTTGAVNILDAIAVNDYIFLGSVCYDPLIR